MACAWLNQMMILYNSRSILHSYFLADCQSSQFPYTSLLVSVLVKLNKNDYKNCDGNADVLISISIFNLIQRLMRDWTRWWLEEPSSAIHDQFSNQCSATRGCCSWQGWNIKPYTNLTHRWKFSKIMQRIMNCFGSKYVIRISLVDLVSWKDGF